MPRTAAPPRRQGPVLAGIFRGSASDSTGIARIAGSRWIAGSCWIAHVTHTHKNRPPGRPERPRSPHTYPACTPHVPYACAPHALLTRLLVLRRAVRVRAAAADLRLPPHLGGTPRFGGGGITRTGLHQIVWISIRSHEIAGDRWIVLDRTSDPRKIPATLGISVGDGGL